MRSGEVRKIYKGHEIYKSRALARGNAWTVWKLTDRNDRQYVGSVRTLEQARELVNWNILGETAEV